MKCRKCGIEIDTQKNFCPGCGSSLEWVKEEQKKRQKKNAKITLLVAAIVCLVAVAGGVGYKIYSDKQKKIQEEWNTYTDQLNIKIDTAEAKKDTYILTDKEKTEYEEMLQNIRDQISDKAKKEELEKYEKKMNDFTKEIVENNQTEINDKKEKMDKMEVKNQTDSDKKEISSYRTNVEKYYNAEEFQKAMDELNHWEQYISLIQNPVDTYRLNIENYDLEDYPNVKLYLTITDRSGNDIYNLDKSEFLVSESSKEKGSYKQQKIVDFAETADGYYLEYPIINADNFLKDCYSNIYVRTKDGEGGYVERYRLDKRKYIGILYEKYIDACVECQEYERTLLDSDLILKSQKNNKDTIAYQSQKSIDEGGTGSEASENYMEKDYCKMLNVKKNKKEYIVYGVAKYNMTLHKKYANVNSTEKAAILDSYPDYSISKTDRFTLEENISNYEKLSLVKDKDGKWKFNTRFYEREDGKSAVMVNSVYNVYWE